jgi:hypothetical protein
MDLPTTEYDQARPARALRRRALMRCCAPAAVLTRLPAQAAAEREAAGAGRNRQQKRREEAPPAHGGGNVGHAADEVRRAAHRARLRALAPGTERSTRRCGMLSAMRCDAMRLRCVAFAFALRCCRACCARRCCRAARAQPLIRQAQRMKGSGAHHEVAPPAPPRSAPPIRSVSPRTRRAPPALSSASARRAR